MTIAPRAAAVMATGFAAALTMTALAAPAFADGAVTSAGPGKLLVKGAAVNVPITFVCDAGQLYFTQLFLSQRVNGGRLAQGADSGNFGDCTGGSQTVTATVFSQTSAFKKGNALAQVDIQTCDADFISCQEHIITTQVRLASK
jgi:hypothetical protein